jgi:PAS domain S-box-containing protein
MWRVEMKKARVLIVEDEKNIGEDIKISLWNLGYEVLALVTNGKEAISKVAELQPDIILMDIELEGDMNGLEATQIIKKQHNIPIIYITSHVDQKTLDSAKVTDAIGYLIKPFEEKELNVTLEMAIYKFQMNSMIRESEEKYRTLVETIDEGIATVDEHENITYINRAGSNIFGCPMDELIGKNLREFIHEKDFQEILKQTGLRKTGKSGKYNIRVKQPSGALRYVIVTASPRFVDSQFKGSFGILSDVTETKLAEEKLRKTELRLTSVFKNVPNIVLYETGEFRYFLSENVKQLTGYSVEDLQSENPAFSSLVHPDDLKIIQEKEENWKKTGAKGMLAQWYRFKRRTGEYIWIEDRKVKIDNGFGETFVSGVMIDNSHLKKAEEALRESEKRYKAVVEDQTEFINRYRSDGTFTFVNDAYCRYLGRTPDELIGKNWLEFFPVERQEVVRMRLFSLKPNDPVATYQYRKILPNNDVKWEEWTYRAFFNEHNEIIEFQSVGKDITERKIAEEQLVREKNRASFFNDLLSHDINNLNHGIFSYLNIMLSLGQLPESISKKIKTCIHLSEEISALIGKVRIFTDLDDEHSDLKEINFKKVLLNSVDTVYMNYSKDKNINISHDFTEDTFFVEANELLETVTYNILNNAVKHNDKENVEITIKHKEINKDLGQFYSIEFADNGPGISDEDKEKVFNRMERIGQDKKVHGFGLGLTLVRSIVEHYNGQILVEDRIQGDYEQGSKFVIYLPKK